MANLDAIYDIDHRLTAFEEHKLGILVCLAGPGTGKTFSLLARSAALGARGCDQDAICYLTFIKEISRAFVDDYVQRFGAAAYAASAPRISTLHSLACRLLRNQGFRVGYDGDLYFANLADADDAAGTFLQDLLEVVTRDGCRTVPQLRSLVETIKSAWQDSRDPASAPEPAPAIAVELVRASRSFRLMDWDQTIPLASSLLDELENWPSWLEKIRHYFVDEYQDFNRAEQALIMDLASHAESVVVVGDDDQSLYSGRGGSPDGIRTLYADARHNQVSLVRCFRCKSAIVAPANTLQAHMGTAPRPMTAANNGGEVRCYRFKSSKAEVAFLTDYLRARLAELPAAPNPKDGILCLFPSHRVLNCYFDLLSPDVPCSRRATPSPARRVWLERILMLLSRPRQRFLERLLLNEYQDLKRRHRTPIAQRVIERDIPPSHACDTLIADGAFQGNALIAAQSYSQLCAALAAKDLGQVAACVAGTLAVSEAVVLQQLDVLMAADPVDRDDLLEPICDALLPDTAAVPQDVRTVMFLTMQGSKGLTRRTVVIPGLEEACLPGAASPGKPSRETTHAVCGNLARDRQRAHYLPDAPGRREGHSEFRHEGPG